MIRDSGSAPLIRAMTQQKAPAENFHRFLQPLLYLLH